MLLKERLEQFRILGVYSGNNLPKIKDWTYIIILDKYKSIGMHFIALYVNGDNATYFDSLGVSKYIKYQNTFLTMLNIS